MNCARERRSITDAHENIASRQVLLQKAVPAAAAQQTPMRRRALVLAVHLPRCSFNAHTRRRFHVFFAQVAIMFPPPTPPPWFCSRRRVRRQARVITRHQSSSPSSLSPSLLTPSSIIFRQRSPFFIALSYHAWFIICHFACRHYFRQIVAVQQKRCCCSYHAAYYVRLRRRRHRPCFQ